MSSTRIALIVLGFSLEMLGVFIGNTSMSSMLERVNRDQTAENKISPYWWYFTKSQRVLNAYKALEPNGEALRRHRMALVLGVTGLVLMAVGLLSSAAQSIRG